jgi:hypothetical protein
MQTREARHVLARFGCSLPRGQHNAQRESSPKSKGSSLVSPSNHVDANERVAHAPSQSFVLGNCTGLFYSAI